VDELVVSPAESMPFPDDAFDAVVSHLVVMLIRDLKAALREVRRVLRRGKPFAFVVPRAPDQSEAAMQLMRSIPGWVREIYPEYTPVNPGDVRVFAPETLETVLRDAGFPVIHIDDFAVEREVGIEDLRRRMGLLYYVGTLPEDALARVHQRLMEWTGDRRLLYREAMRIVVAH
jgi:SAM-dependent methyltransferase